MSEKRGGENKLNLNERFVETHNKNKKNYQKEMELRDDASQIVARLLKDKPLTVKKIAFNPDEPTYPVSFGREDDVEIKTEVLENNVVRWFIRNETIVSKEKKEEFPGELREMTKDELEEFIKSIDPRKISLSELHHVLSEFDNLPRYRKVYGYFDEMDSPIAFAYLGEESESVAGITSLIVNPDFHSNGIGRALLNELKNKYKALSVNIVAKSIDLDSGTANQKLHKFYKENGFVAGEWSRNQISLDDINTAGSWQEITSRTFNIGVGQHLVSTEHVKRVVFSTILESPALLDDLSDEEIKKLREWEEVDFKRVYLERELEKIKEMIKVERKRSKGPIVGHRTIFDTQNQINDDKAPKRDNELGDKKEITIGEPLPQEYEEVLNQIRDDAPDGFKKRAREAAYLFWALENNAKLFDEGGESLQELKDNLAKKLRRSGFVGGVFIRAQFKLFGEDKYDINEALPHWITNISFKKSGEPFNERDEQVIENFYQEYTQEFATPYKSSDRQTYHRYNTGTVSEKKQTYPPVSFKMYIESRMLRNTTLIKKAMLQLTERGLHPDTTKLFEGNRLVLYWELPLHEDLAQGILEVFERYDIEYRGPAQDPKELKIEKNGVIVIDNRAGSNDASLGEAGRNPFTWEEKVYDPIAFFKKYLQLVFFGAKDPIDPYRINFIPLVDNSDGKYPERLELLNRKVRESGFEVFATNRPYFDLFYNK